MSELTEQQAEELANFSANLTMDQVWEVDKACQRDSGVNRRVLLLTLTKDGKELQELAVEQPEVVFDMFKCGVDHLNRIQDLQELFDSACTRLMVSLCVLDWDSEDVPFTEEQFGAVCSLLHRKGDSPTD